MLDTTVLDDLASGNATPEDLVPLELAACCAFEPAHIAITDAAIVVLGSEGSMASFDPDTGEPLGTANVPGAVDLEGVPGTDLVLADPAAIGDTPAAAEALAEDLAMDPALIEERLRAGADEVVVAGWMDDAALAAIQERIDDGSLTGDRP